MRMTRLLSATALIAALSFLSGCLSTPELRGIAVQLTDIRAQPLDQGGAEVSLTIRYLNENLVAIAVSETEHRIWIDGMSLGRIESDQPVGLPQLGEASETLKLTVDASTAARLRQLQANGSANYRLESRLLVMAAQDELKSNTSGTGTVDVSNLGL